MDKIDTFLKDYSILITGGSGFLGSLLAKRLKDIQGIRRVIIFSRDWHKQEALRRELGSPENFRWFIGDVRDLERLRRAFAGVDYVLHLASIKDVISSEYNPRETVLTNVIGTQYVSDAAIDCGVKRVVVVSTDKSSAPLNVYGKSKALAESISVSANNYGQARFCSARYGNVIGSSSSVIPLFKSQKESGTLTLTDENMTRFWISAPQAVEFVLKCLVEMKGGEIFVPHLPSAKIIDIATTIAPEAKIEIIGTRPGEKMHEVMIVPEEAHRTRDLGWAYEVLPEFPFWSGLHFPMTAGSPVPEGWTYSSASAQRLTPDEIKVITE